MRTNMKIKSISVLILVTLLAISCRHRTKPLPSSADTQIPISLNTKAEGDSAIYGLVCPSSADSLISILPFTGGDPVTYNVFSAIKENRIYGNPDTGDWICIMPCHDDPHKAYSIIDLDEIKGTWTYPVMPHLRDVSHLTKRQQERILANMPDSIIKTYMIPRQYGFTLQRMSVAKPVGFVNQTSDVEDDSPVEYPAVPFFTEWHAYNGRIILVKGQHKYLDKWINKTTVRDTFDLVYMQNDSLVIRNHEGKVYSFHRQKNALTANAKANAMAEKQEKKLKDRMDKNSK